MARATNSIQANVRVDPAFFAAVRNLADSLDDTSEGPRQAIQYLGGAKLITTSHRVVALANEQLERQHQLARSQQDDFAGTAQYMGSKRRLAGFLVEAIAPRMTRSTPILDLMCGGGSAARGFAQFWPTYASDAQAFCRLLAMIQGGGYTPRKAGDALEAIVPRAGRIIGQIRERLHGPLKREDELLHKEPNERLLREYTDFCASFPTYPGTSEIDDWSPGKEVASRRRGEVGPPCLFTSYFANHFFGLRQSVEFDALRGAIQDLTNETDRLWTLGALVVTASSLGTGYAGHFAQSSRIGQAGLAKVAERRARPVVLEFQTRLTSLAEHSAAAARPIQTLEGPWRRALESFADAPGPRKRLVYLDAPYTREEYSRYYHVLETLVRYDYPAAEGRGRVPRKHSERFASEFFTMARPTAIEAYARVIDEVLQHGWTCAWSYANRAMAGVPEVVEAVESRHRVGVESYATPYVHRSQGPRAAKPTTEYLVVIEGQ